MGTNVSERLGIRYEDFHTFVSWAKTEKSVPEDLLLEVLQAFVTGGSLKQAIKKFAMNSPVKSEYVVDQFSAWALFSELGEFGTGEAGFQDVTLSGSKKYIELPDMEVENEILQKRHKAMFKGEEDVDWIPIEEEERDIVRQIVALIMKRYGTPEKDIVIERIGK